MSHYGPVLSACVTDELLHDSGVAHQGAANVCVPDIRFLRIVGVVDRLANARRGHGVPDRC